MSVMELDFTELMRIVLIMSLAGSVVALLLFMLKPFIKDRLPKSFQYYMWFAVLVSLIVPLSKIVVLPEPSASINHTVSLTPIHDVVQRNFYTVEKEIDRLISLTQGENKQEIEKTQSRFTRLATIFSIVWALGMFVFLSFTIISYLLFARKLKKYTVRANTHETELLNKLSKNGCAPCLCHSPIAPTPMLIGAFRPIIMLPDKEYTDTQLQNILLHELTHLRRYDIVMKWLSVLAGALHWFNPIIYLVRREIDRTCELACDEVVIKNLDTDGKQNYGDTLIAIVAGNKTPKTALSTTMCEDKKALKERLGAIMKYTKFSRKAIVLSSVLFVIILCGTILLGAANATSDIETPESRVGVNYSSVEIATRAKQIELESSLLSFNNIDGANILLNSDNEISSASIVLTTNEVISDSEIDNIVLLISKSVENLEKGNIQIKDQDTNTIYPRNGF